MFARIRKSQEEEGFTLIELLVVMIIIGILAAIAIPMFLNQKKKAKETANKADATNISKELAAAGVDGPFYAATLAPQTGSTVIYDLKWTSADGTADATTVRVTAGHTATLVSPGVSTAPSDTFCVTVKMTDATDDASPWSAGNNGLKKGLTC